MRVRWLLRAVEDLEDVRDYIAAYRIKGDIVEILRVLHAAGKWPKRF